MNILVVGSGSASWQMRGVQIGDALGARVTSRPSVDEWRWAHVVLLIKRSASLWAPYAHLYGVPIVWDVIDVWQQPQHNGCSIEQGVQLVQRLRAVIRPAAMIAATKQMAEDIGGVYIPHHSRIGLLPTPPRDAMQVVAYDGSERYLDDWQTPLLRLCERQGWQFRLNPIDLRAVDVFVALRGGQWDGPLCRAWKSGVKYVNAICAGRPIVTQESAARRELNPVTATVAFVHELEAAVLAASHPASRQQAYEHGLITAGSFDVRAIAETSYRPLLASVAREGTCAA